MIELACGIMMSVALILLLEQDRLRNLMGIILLSTVINICILLCGRLEHKTPAFIGQGDALSNPLTQACVLTALVIGFGLIAFLTLLIKARKTQDE